MTSINGNILEVINLKTQFFTRRGTVKAVDGVNFELRQGECLCLVGESGCGKTVTVLSILGLIESPPGRIMGGEAIYKNLDLIITNRFQVKLYMFQSIIILLIHFFTVSFINLIMFHLLILTCFLLKDLNKISLKNYMVKIR